jgi:hypothetical protein
VQPPAAPPCIHLSAFLFSTFTPFLALSSHTFMFFLSFLLSISLDQLIYLSICFSRSHLSRLRAQGIGHVPSVYYHHYYTVQSQCQPQIQPIHKNEYTTSPNRFTPSCSMNRPSYALNQYPIVTTLFTIISFSWLTQSLKPDSSFRFSCFLSFFFLRTL